MATVKTDERVKKMFPNHAGEIMEALVALEDERIIAPGEDWTIDQIAVLVGNMKLSGHSMDKSGSYSERFNDMIYLMLKTLGEEKGYTIDHHVITGDFIDDIREEIVRRVYNFTGTEGYPVDLSEPDRWYYFRVGSTFRMAGESDGSVLKVIKHGRNFNILHTESSHLLFFDEEFSDIGTMMDSFVSKNGEVEEV